MTVRAIRGATTCEENTASSINEATQEMLLAILERNVISPNDIISAFFTVSADLNAAFPAAAARGVGFQDVPLMCAVEIDVPGAMSRCIRVMLHIETQNERRDIRHVYLREAQALRHDLSAE